MSNYNLPLLRKERDWVAEQMALPFAESQLEMDWWSADGHIVEAMGKDCGTTYCVAGHVAATTPGIGWSGAGMVEVDGRQRSIVDWAAEQLGISGREASDLFFCDNGDALDELNALIKRAEEEERADG